MVIEAKTAQLVELDEEPINLFSLIGQGVQKSFFLFQNACTTGWGWSSTSQELVEGLSRYNGHLSCIKC